MSDKGKIKVEPVEIDLEKIKNIKPGDIITIIPPPGVTPHNIPVDFGDKGPITIPVKPVNIDWEKLKKEGYKMSLTPSG